MLSRTIPTSSPSWLPPLPATSRRQVEKGRASWARKYHVCACKVTCCAICQLRTCYYLLPAWPVGSWTYSRLFINIQGYSTLWGFLFWFHLPNHSLPLRHHHCQKVLAESKSSWRPHLFTSELPGWMYRFQFGRQALELAALYSHEFCQNNVRVARN